MMVVPVGSSSWTDPGPFHQILDGRAATVLVGSLVLEIARFVLPGPLPPPFNNVDG